MADWVSVVGRVAGQSMADGVPYISQFARTDHARSAWTWGGRGIDLDGWAEWGAATVEEYAFWAPRACAAACARSVLLAHGHHPPPLGEMCRLMVEADIYV